MGITLDLKKSLDEHLRDASRNAGVRKAPLNSGSDSSVLYHEFACTIAQDPKDRIVVEIGIKQEGSMNFQAKRVYYPAVFPREHNLAGSIASYLSERGVTLENKNQEPNF